MTIYHVRQKNCTVLFLQHLYKNSIYSGNFWHTYTLINLLSYVYFIFLTRSKSGNQLKFQHYNAQARCSHSLQAALSREDRCLHSTQTVTSITSQTLMLWTTESGQCYKSESVNSLFEISMSWGDVWLTLGQAQCRIKVGAIDAAALGLFVK